MEQGTWGLHCILEHLGNNDEESALANGGFMLWGKMTEAEYTEAAMGYGGDLNFGSWQARGWQWPNLVTYAESHDEERMAYELATFGNAVGGIRREGGRPRAWTGWPWRTAFLLAIPGAQDDVAVQGSLDHDISIFDCLAGTARLQRSASSNEKPGKTLGGPRQR